MSQKDVFNITIGMVILSSYQTKAVLDDNRILIETTKETTEEHTDILANADWVQYSKGWIYECFE